MVQLHDWHGVSRHDFTAKRAVAVLSPGRFEDMWMRHPDKADGQTKLWRSRPEQFKKVVRIVSTDNPIIGIVPARSGALLGWTLALLFIVNTMSSVDRLLFAIVQELIKVDLALSDFQLGLLGGPAFALLYAVAAFPIARFADRHNRVNIITIVFIAWSAMTTLCGFAGSFIHMLFARAGVSIGEAGCTPPAHSLISDMFPPERRMGAISIYAAGGPVGAMAAAIGGGWFAQHYGWRPTFFLCGGIGLAFAILLRLTLREPARSHAPAVPTGFIATLSVILHKRSYVMAATSGSLASFAINAINQYFVSFLIRAHDMPLSAAGTVMGLATGGVGIVSILIAGTLVDRTRLSIPQMRTWLPAGGMIWCGVFYITAFAVADARLAVALLLLAALGQGFWVPAIYTIAQDVAPPSMRSTSAALMIAIVSVVGYGFGPPLVGLASDVFSHLAMQANGTSAAACASEVSIGCAKAAAGGLRLSLSLGATVWIAAGLVFLLSGRTIAADSRH